MEETRDVKKETKNKVNNEKTKMKLWKKILILIGIIFIIFIADTCRKFIIIRQIQNQYEKDYASTNYYVKTNNLSDGYFSETWSYEEKYLFKHSSYDEKGLQEKMIYQDRENKEAWILVNSAEGKTAVKLDYNENTVVMPAGSIGGLPAKNDALHVQIFCAVLARITSEKWADTDCYKIKLNDEFKMWIDKNTNREIAEVNGTSIINGQKVLDIITREVKFNQNTEKDTQIPDLTGYTIIDQTTNTNIQ